MDCIVNARAQHQRDPFKVTLSLVMMSSAFASPLGAQSRGGFVATLGTDTVQVESFDVHGRDVQGVVLVRTPTLRTLRWRMTVGDSGRMTSYEVRASDVNGRPIVDGVSGSMRLERDSIVRVSYRAGAADTQRISAPRGAVPGPGLPYLGVSYLIYEAALRNARQPGAPAIDTAVYQLTLNSGQRSVLRTRAWLVGADSAELDYFNAGRSGYKFDGAGRLLRSDWTGTTYRYKVRRVDAIDIAAIGDAWAAAERNGAAFGALSPRDSTIAVVAGTTVRIDYSRPAARGRVVWGEVVPWDRVWRLGADMATHITLSHDLRIGETVIPAGRYSLWMLPSKTAPQLIVNSAVGVFGTNYPPSRDFARIPLMVSTGNAHAERLTISVNETALSIHWADTIWRVAVAAP